MTNLYHSFGEVQGPGDDPSKSYKQCQRCRKVMFIEDDDNFNLYCYPKIEDREKLRRDLEAK